MSRTRDIVDILSVTEKANPDNRVLLDSDLLPVTAAGNPLQYFSSLDSLPSAGLTAGDTAYVAASNRFYISNGNGWYNVALVNVTPSLTISPDGAITLSNDGTPTTITLTGQDSDNANLTFSVESDGSFLGLGTIVQDSSVFTITPFSEDSATQTQSTLTFKVTDGVGIGSGTSALSLTFSITNSQHTNMLLKADTAGDDNQVDASSSSHTITEHGNVTSSAHTPYHPGGYSTYFDGTGDYLSVAYSADHTFGSGQFTVECWVFMTAYSSTGFNTFMYKSDGTNVDWQFDYKNSATQLRFIPYVSSSAETSAAVATATLALNTWHHIAASRDGSNNLRLFHNGSLLKTTSYSSTIDADGNATLHVGARLNSSTSDRLLTGFIKDLRIVKGSAVYTSAFSVPTSSLSAITNTKLLMCHAPFIADGSDDRHAITVGGNTETARWAPYEAAGSYSKASHGGSVYFDGSGDYITTGTSTDFAYGTGDFTIECWVYCHTTPGTYKYIYAQSTSTTPIGIGIYIQSGVYKVYSNSSAVISGSSVVGASHINSWQHVALSRSGTSLRLFINGNLAGSATNSSSINSGSTYGANIGRWIEIADAQSFPGYIADLRVVKGTAVYTSAFTPPTAPLTAITNTKLLTLTNKQDFWDAAGSGPTAAGTTQITTKAGNVTASNTQRKFTGSSSVYFDGNGDYYTHPVSKTVGTGDFTVEGWVYFSTIGGGGVFHAYAGGFDYNTASGFALGINNSDSYWRVYHNGAATNASTAPSASTWYHFAYVRSSGTIKLYIDGTATDISISDSDDYPSSEYTLGGYYSSTYVMHGYIQDFRVSPSLARYTSNFTPPTALFDG